MAEDRSFPVSVVTTSLQDNKWGGLHKAVLPKGRQDRGEIEFALRELAKKARLTSEETAIIHPYASHVLAIPVVTNDNRQHMEKALIDLNSFVRVVRQILLREMAKGRKALSQLKVSESMYRSSLGYHFCRVVPFVAQMYQCVLPGCLDSARFLELALLSKVKIIDQLQISNGIPENGDIVECGHHGMNVKCTRHSRMLQHPLDSSGLPYVDEELEFHTLLDWVQRGGNFYSSSESNNSDSFLEPHMFIAAYAMKLEVVNTKISILEESITGSTDLRRISGWLVGSFTAQCSEESKQATSDEASSRPLNLESIPVNPLMQSADSETWDSAPPSDSAAGQGVGSQSDQIDIAMKSLNVCETGSPNDGALKEMVMEEVEMDRNKDRFLKSPESPFRGNKHDSKASDDSKKMQFGSMPSHPTCSSENVPSLPVDAEDVRRGSSNTVPPIQREKPEKQSTDKSGSRQHTKAGVKSTGEDSWELVTTKKKRNKRRPNNK